jgi:CBS domain-containing protein
MRREQAEDVFGAHAAIQTGDEALVLEVHGGELRLLLPAQADVEQAVRQARLIRGVLHLETERALAFEIDPTAATGRIEVEVTPLQQERRPAGELAGVREEARVASAQMTAADIMTREVLTTRPNVPVRELAKRLSFHRISGMPVVDDQGVVLGIVSEADVISKRGATVADIMTTPVIGVEESTPAVEVAALLTEERIKRVPVLRDGRLIGLIGRSNVVSWVAGQSGGAGAA